MSFENIKGYLNSHWTDTRLVCTHWNALVMQNRKIVIIFHNFEIYDSFFLLVFCSWRRMFTESYFHLKIHDLTVVKSSRLTCCIDILGVQSVEVREMTLLIWSFTWYSAIKQTPPKSLCFLQNQLLSAFLRVIIEYIRQTPPKGLCLLQNQL